MPLLPFFATLKSTASSKSPYSSTLTRSAPLPFVAVMAPSTIDQEAGISFVVVAAPLVDGLAVEEELPAGGLLGRGQGVVGSGLAVHGRRHGHRGGDEGRGGEPGGANERERTKVMGFLEA